MDEEEMYFYKMYMQERYYGEGKKPCNNISLWKRFISFLSKLIK